jgi:hypothetical protein
MFISIALATTASKTVKGYGNKTYNLYITGSVSKLNAEATETKCYSILRNTTGGMESAFVKVQSQYTDDGGVIDFKSKTNTSLTPNTSLPTSALTRETGSDKSYISYVHYGVVYDYTNQSVVKDKLTYTVNP